MISQSRDTSVQAERVQIELLRQAGVSRRVALARSLSQTAMFLSRRAIQRANPSFSRRQVDLAFVAVHYGEDLAVRLRLYLERKQL